MTKKDKIVSIILIVLLFLVLCGVASAVNRILEWLVGGA